MEYRLLLRMNLTPGVKNVNFRSRCRQTSCFNLYVLILHNTRLDYLQSPLLLNWYFQRYLEFLSVVQGHNLAFVGTGLGAMK